MKMIRAKVNNGYGGVQDRYFNPDKIRAIGNTRDGTTVWFDEGCMVVLDSASELAKQWEHCNLRLADRIEEAARRELEAKDSVIQTLTARKASKGSGVA